MAGHLVKDTIPNMFFNSYKMGEKPFRAILLATITVNVKELQGVKGTLVAPLLAK